MFKSLRRFFGRHKDGESGQSMLEFAISAVVFLALFFAAIDFGFFFFAKVTLQNAVRQAGRYAITGNCGSAGNCFNSGGKQNGNRLPIILQTVQRFSYFLNPTVTVSCVGSCPDWAKSGGDSAGGPQDVVQITATYDWYPFMITKFYPKSLPGGHVNLNISSFFKNEPFAPPAS